MFADSFIMDSAYSYAYGGDAEYTYGTGANGVKMCHDNGTCDSTGGNYSKFWYVVPEGRPCDLGVLALSFCDCSLL